MNRIFIIAIIIISSIPGSQTFAQNKKEKKAKEKEKVPVYNYVIDDPMDAFGRTRDTTSAIARRSFSEGGSPALNPALPSTLLFPDFYSYNPIRKGDTLFKYLCYDRRDSLINVDTLQNIDLVRYISLFISYTDHDHNYKDAEGKYQPLPVSKIIRRYDKLGTDKWMSIDYANNKYIELHENKSDITRTETVNITHPITHTQFTHTHNYYKVSK